MPLRMAPWRASLTTARLTQRLERGVLLMAAGTWLQPVRRNLAWKQTAGQRLDGGPAQLQLGPVLCSLDESGSDQSGKRPGWERFVALKFRGIDPEYFVNFTELSLLRA